jgi:hypothetical protein
MPDKASKQDKTEQSAAPDVAMEQQAPKVALRFSDAGDGRYLAGVPQRDLTADDLANLTPGQFRDAVASGLYTVADAAAIAAQFGGEKE